MVARVLTARGAVCARGVPSDPNELARAQKILAACGVTDAVFTAPGDDVVTGRTAAAVFEQIEKALSG